MNTYYVGSDAYRIDTDPPSSKLWTEFLDAISALNAYERYVTDLQRSMSDKEDDNADLRDKVAELEERIAELEAEAGER
jgi:predicted  nucleic acid-binding Zn-ribbon protein